MNNLSRYLYMALGALLSLNQGITVVLGTMSDGRPRGADVLMPMDIPLYALYLLQPAKNKDSSAGKTIALVRGLLLVIFLWALSGDFVAVEYAEFRFQMVHFTRALLICNLLATRLSTRNDVLSFVKGLLLGLFFQSAIGFYQWQIGPVVLPFMKITNIWRATGTVGVANAYGAYLITLTPLAIRMAMFVKVKYKFFWWGVLALNLGALFASYSRGAWFSFIIAMAVFTAVDFGKKKISQKQLYAFVALSILFFVIVLVKYNASISNRMENAQEAMMGEKKHSRLGLALDAIEIIKRNTIVGVGLDNYHYHADQEIAGTKIVHNVYLMIAAEQGVPTAVLFLILHIVVFIKGLKILTSPDPMLYQVGAGALTGFLAMMIYYNGAPDYRIGPVLMQHWRTVGLVLALLATNDFYKKMLLRKLHMAKIKPAAAGPAVPPSPEKRFNTFPKQGRQR